MNTLDYKITQIKNRYAIYDRPLNGLKNVILDSFFPSHLINGYTNAYNMEDSFPKTFATISEFASSIMNVPLVPREELFRMLGYTTKDLKALALAVKRKRLNFVMLGMGGTNSNTIYWLREICNLTNTINLFESLAIIENDHLSLDNLIRMPMSPFAAPTPLRHANMRYKTLYRFNDTLSPDAFSAYNRPHEDLLPDVAYVHSVGTTFHISNRQVRTPNNVSKLALVVKGYDHLANKPLRLLDDYYKPERGYYNTHYSEHGSCYASGYYLPQNAIYYGAPDIATRSAMHDSGKPLITTTHGDDSISISINPIQDALLQRESYGVIKLGIFFMNQIRATIGLLELLASDTDLTAPNQSFLEFDYKTNTNTKPTDRQWHMQIDHDGLLRT